MALDIASFVIEKLTNPVLQEASLLYSVAGKVASVKNTLEYIKVFLEAAEKVGKEDKAVKLWVDQVREVSFRIEDAIDIYILEIKGDRKGCCSFGFIRWFYRILKKPMALHNLGTELNDIEVTLKEIDRNRQSFNINDPGGSSSGKENPPTKRSYEYPDTEIVGLVNEKKAIVKKLLDPQAPKLNAVSIVGIGGIGKTTLARKVFHSAEVAEKFDERIWISVSRQFDKISILKKMLENFRTINQEEKDQDEIYFIKEIRKCFIEKKILLVLDDVWCETLWPDIKMVCPDDMDHAGVLITTRNLNVAKKAQSELHEPRLLDLEESKMLLYKVSFPNYKQEYYPESLDSAATEIAEKCRGLPLAIVVVGGRLYLEHKSSEWRKVAESLILLGRDQECMQILAASYEDMPTILKTCFVYLASFPEGFKIDAKSLVRTWVAESLASDEVTAENYLQELAQRCLVIITEKAYDGSIEKFWVHDLLLELAIKKANEAKFLSVFAKQIPDKISFNNARRASLQSCTFDERNGNNSKNKRKVEKKYNKKLRSVLIFTSIYDFDVNKLVPLAGFRLLKVLTLYHCSISFSTLEKWCQELIHLRHLELRNCRVDNKEIPKDIDRLENLLTLDCSFTSIDKLPESLWSIKTLRHVVMINPRCTPELPLPSADLPNYQLRTLCNVILDPPSSSPNPRLDDRSYHVSNLRELELHGVCPWVTTVLKEAKQLISLELTNYGRNVRLPLDVLDMRGFLWYQSLRRLLLGGKWPKDVDFKVHLLPPKLTWLSLQSCNLRKDPTPELERLQYLEILKLSYRFLSLQLSAKMTCSARGFPQLQELYVTNIPGKEFIITPSAMPMLKKLCMTFFIRMKNIPELQYLRKLREFRWTGAPYTDVKIQAMKEKDQHKLQHIAFVIITPKLI